MKITKIAAQAAVLVALISGCDTVDTFDWNSKYYGTADQVYSRSFAELFPKVSCDNIWSTVNTDSVKVTVLSPDATVGAQVFTSDPTGSRSDCFMMYEGTINTGSAATLVFDAPKGLEYVYVGLVQSDGVRVVIPVEMGNSKSIRLKPVQSYMSAGISLLTPASTSFYPFTSSYYNHSATTYSQFLSNFNRSNGLCTSFEYMSRGSDIYLIPFGNSTESRRTLYYYAYNPTGTTLETVEAAIGDGTISGTELYASSETVVWATGSSTQPYRTKPYILRGVPAGYHVLFYTVSTSGRVLASNANYNSNGRPAAGVMEVNGHTIVRFDDTGSNASINGTRTRGYDDFAFGLYGGVVIDFENSPSSYNEYGVTYAFEAPLTTEETDFDFNDAIVRVHHVAGRTQLHIVPVAVGEKGCEINLAACGSVRQAELHALLGTDTTETVNTTSITVTQFDTTTVSVASDYLMSQNLQDIQFNLKVGSESVRSYTLPSAGSNTNVFLIASPRWNWSLEGTSIDVPYPQVVRWAAVPDGYSTWYTTLWSTLNTKAEALSFLAGDDQL